MSWTEYWSTSWAVWLGAFCVLAIYSYLFRDNPLYRLMMQIFIGINVGYAVVVQWKDILYPLWWLPMTDGIEALLGRGQGSPYGALWVLVGCLGLLWYFQLSRRYLWLSRIVIGITVGIGAGFTFKSLFGQNIPQVVDSFRPLGPSAIAVQPRPLFPLPASSVPPLLDEPLLVLAAGRQALAVETLEGREVWRCPLPAEPSARLRSTPEGIVVPCGDKEVLINRDTGRGTVRARRPVPPTLRGQTGLESGWQPDGGRQDVLVKQGVVSPDGREILASYRMEPSGLAAMSVSDVDGRTLWPQAPPVAGSKLFDGSRYLLVAGDREAFCVDASLGTVVSRVPLPASPNWMAVARMADPVHDQATLLAAFPSGEILGFAAAEHRVSRQTAGALLWRTSLRKPVVWLGSSGGVLFAVGPEGGSALELPNVPKALGASDYWDNWVFVVTLVCVMSYFFFSFRSEPRAVTGVRRMGRWLLMLGFGAFFGNTVMSRMSFLLDRLMFLVDEWIKPFFQQLLG
ncbi:MAG: PQQ-like beta-propeller repeat protein [Fimbriimonadales bacterium]|nr:PQQ-like beta-propeller repeat protein [Fimbriimonadales bacterium]